MTRAPFRLRHVAAAALLTLLATGAVAVPASAHTSADAIVASGAGWTVERAPAGFRVTLTLDASLPLVSDAPTLLVDGESIGPAQSSVDGRTLTVVTADPRVADATDVQKGWASGSGPKSGEDGAERSDERRAREPENEELRRQLDALDVADPIADPATPGPYAVTEAEYDFGDAAIPLAGYLQETRGEVTGKMYLSSAEGARPVVVFEHGRHMTCGVVATGEDSGRWPCAPDEIVIRSYLGYEGTARALASHGYNVVSISANAINATDNALALDYGAQARGRLVLDSLGLLERLSAGEPVSFEDRPDGSAPVTRSFDEALDAATTRADQPAAASGITASDLKGRFDLSRVGLMGHSRGGEGVVAAAQLNAAADKRYGIRSVLPLAPTDFARRTLPDVTTAVVLPYCDGDVADQQGQRYVDDSRHAFDDDVLRSAIWVMGANHNFFSSVWTPETYPVGGGDDWPQKDTTSSCAATDSSRLSAAEQYQVGVSFMTGFFRLTLGGEEAFRTLFDGSAAPRTTATEFADVRVMATQPPSAATLVTDFAGRGADLVVSGDAATDPCENGGASSTITCVNVMDAQNPHWGHALFAPFVPTYPATKYFWSSTDALLRVLVPEAQRDVSDRAQLTLKTVPSDDVKEGTDFSLTLVDGSGGSYTIAASALNPFAVNRMPGGYHLLDKRVLQQVTLPLSRVSGVDLSDVREVRIAPLTGADGTVSGGVVLSDLSFDSPSSGTPEVMPRASVNMAPNKVDARSEPWDTAVAAFLDRPAQETVTAWVSTLPAPQSTGSDASLEARLVTFEPGQVCVAVPVHLWGESATTGAERSLVVTAITTSRPAVSGTDDFSGLVVRSPEATDGLPFGVAGDVCAEWEASRTPGQLSLSSAQPRQGETVRVIATGYRPGEAVLASFGTTELSPVIASAEGTAVIDAIVPADAAPGTVTVTATGAGSSRVQTADAEIAVAPPAPTPSPTGSTPSPSASATEAPTGLEGTALPRTGVDAAQGVLLALFGGLLIAVGAGVVLRRGVGRTR